MTLVPFLPPGLTLILGGLVIPALPRGRARDAWLLGIPVLALMQIVLMPTAFTWQWEVFGWRLLAVRADGLSQAFAYVFGIATVIAALYLRGSRDAGGERAAALVYAGAAIGAVYAGDLVTLFVFWELTAIASAFLIWLRRTDRAYAVGLRYLVIQVTSGLLLLGGALALQANGERIAFDWIGGGDLAGHLILAAFLLKGAVVPLHLWLTDAYPEATDAGAAIMSMFTTKLAMYALIRGFAGTEWLVPLGVAGAVYALLRLFVENDARRAVCWALVIQLGIITAAVGSGTPAALAGAALHAFAGVFYIALMLFALGVVAARTGETRLDRLGGLWRTMPVTTGLFIVGAASLSAVPLFAGFASKTLVFGALEPWAYKTLQAVSVGTFLAAGLRLPWLVFFAASTKELWERPSGRDPMEADLPQLTAMTAAAVLCVLIGVVPHQFLRLLPWRTPLDVWAVGPIVSQALLLGAAAAVFIVLVWLRRVPRPSARELPDLDWAYRRALPAAASAVRAAVAPAWSAATDRLTSESRRAFDAVLRHHGPQGLLGRTWPTGSMALWVAVMLGLSLLVYYL